MCQLTRNNSTPPTTQHHLRQQMATNRADKEFVFQNLENGISLFNAETLETKLLMDNSSFVSLNHFNVLFTLAASRDFLGCSALRGSSPGVRQFPLGFAAFARDNGQIKDRSLKAYVGTACWVGKRPLSQSSSDKNTLCQFFKRYSLVKRAGNGLELNIEAITVKYKLLMVFHDVFMNYIKREFLKPRTFAKLFCKLLM